MFCTKLNFRFRWLIDNEEEKIEEWSPCLGIPEYGMNITQPITLTPPSTGTQGTTEYNLSCIAVQYFNQAENGTLGTESRADILVKVTEEKENGHNITVSKFENFFENLIIKF